MKLTAWTESLNMKTCFSGITATGLIIVMSRPVMAASEKGEESGGLPQLDFSTWPTQIFWLVVSFALAYLLMWRIVVPRIGSVLEERHNRIEDDLSRARQASDDAEQAREAFEKMLADARSDGNEMTRKTTESIMSKMERKVETANASLSKKMAEAEAEIAKARGDALKEVSDIATASAMDVVAQLTGMKVGKTDAKRLVKQAEKAVI
jgi:F-type H+-transporting ATPase subunit b